MRRFSFQWFLKSDPWQQDIACAVNQLITARLIVIHSFTDLRHAVDSLVEDHDLVVAHVVINDHLATTHEGHLANLTRIEPTDMNVTRNSTGPLQGRKHHVFNARLNVADA